MAPRGRRFSRHFDRAVFLKSERCGAYTAPPADLLFWLNHSILSPLNRTAERALQGDGFPDTPPHASLLFGPALSVKSLRLAAEQKSPGGLEVPAWRSLGVSFDQDRGMRAVRQAGLPQRRAADIRIRKSRDSAEVASLVNAP